MLAIDVPTRAHHINSNLAPSVLGRVYLAVEEVAMKALKIMPKMAPELPLP